MFIHVDEKGNVIGQYDAEYVPDVLREKVIHVDFVPPLGESPFGKVSYHYYDGTKVIVKYADRPLTQDEKIEQMEQQQKLMQRAIDDLIFGGGF